LKASLVSAAVIAVLAVVLANPSLSLPSVAHVDTSVQSLPVGAWWILTGAYHNNLNATEGGPFAGDAIIEHETYAQKLTVMSVNNHAIIIRSSYNGTWTCTGIGDWVDGCGDSESYSSQMDYTIDIASLQVMAISNSLTECPWHPTSNLPITKDCVGYPTSILLPTNIGMGDKALEYWYAPDGNDAGDTITNVFWKVDGLQKISVDGVDVTVKDLTYSGEHLGNWFGGTGVYSKGLRKDTELYDTVYGINMGWIIDGTYIDPSDSWTETSHNAAQIAGTNLEIQSRLPQISTIIGWPTNVVSAAAVIVLVILLALLLTKRAQTHKISKRLGFKSGRRTSIGTHKKSYERRFELRCSPR